MKRAEQRGAKHSIRIPIYVLGTLGEPDGSTEFCAKCGGGSARFRYPGSQAAAATSKMIGIQVGAVSFVDEGVEQGAGRLPAGGLVNTLFVATFTYGRGIAGRQVPGQPLPDHGKQEYDTDTFNGGSYTRIHPQYYRDTVLKDFRAPDFGDYDVLEAVLPEARKRGMKTICWFEDVWAGDVPNIAQAQEKRLRRQQRHHAVLQQSELPQLAARLGGGLRALLRDRRHHVGLGAPRRVCQYAGREPRRQRQRAWRGPRASASSASQGARRGASIRRARAQASRRWPNSCRPARRASGPWTATTSRSGA